MRKNGPRKDVSKNSLEVLKKENGFLPLLKQINR